MPLPCVSLDANTEAVQSSFRNVWTKVDHRVGYIHQSGHVGPLWDLLLLGTHRGPKGIILPQNSHLLRAFGAPRLTRNVQNAAKPSKTPPNKSCLSTHFYAIWASPGALSPRHCQTFSLGGLGPIGIMSVESTELTHLIAARAIFRGEHGTFCIR